MFDEGKSPDPQEEPAPLILLFMHDHLKEVTRIQCRVIESALLGEEFISQETVDHMKMTASVYISYAEQIEAKMAKQN